MRGVSCHVLVLILTDLSTSNIVPLDPSNSFMLTWTDLYEYNPGGDQNTCLYSWTTSAGNPGLYYSKNKGEAGNRLKEWKALVENERGLKLGRLRTDNGGEFTSVALRTWLKEKGVSEEFTPPRTPKANGVAEQMNRTLQEMARSMMQDTGLGGGI